MIIHYFLSRFVVGQPCGENLSPEGRICRQVFQINLKKKKEEKEKKNIK
jgi:ribosomal protein L28